MTSSGSAVSKPLFLLEYQPRSLLLFPDQTQPLQPQSPGVVFCWFFSPLKRETKAFPQIPRGLC